MSSSPALYKFPPLFKRLKSQQNKIVQHLIKLRESKQYRLEENRVIVQGLKTVQELKEKKIPLKSIIVTAELAPYDESAIKFPANQILKHPDALPAENHYLVNVDLTRRILGTASRPSKHEIFAEIPIPKHDLPKDKNEIDRLLIFNHVNDPGNLGNLVRTGQALGWSSGVITTGTCDLYNDKTIRASRALSLSWKYEKIGVSQLLSFLKEYDMTPLVADMLPSMNNNNNNNNKNKNKNDTIQPLDLWSPLTGNYHSKKNQPTIGSGIWLWNFKNNQGKPYLPKRPALILSSEHNGVQGLDDEIRISLPMTNNVESLNVACAGSLLMNELNHLLIKK
ncbi:unnamed protein product [Cunninghamella blakesleeana]